MANKTVTTFAELKAAVEDADTTEVTLGADIVFQSGIKIPTTKKTFTLDGQGYTVTDMNSSAASSALYVPTGFGSAQITVKNAVWSGRNYYGVVCVYDDTANAGVSVLLDNVKYNGPQAIYNRYGTTTVNDCDFTIEKNGASSSAQEFCEANRLIISGKTTVNCSSTSTAVMWFAFAGAELTVAAGATVNISAPNTYLIYSDTAAKPKLTFGQSSSTAITVKGGMFYASGSGAHIASSCVIEQGASLSVTSSTNSGVPLFKCAGNFTLMQGGSLFLVLPQSGSSPLMYFSVAAKVDFQSPKNVVLYDNGGKVFSFAAGGTVAVSAAQANYWTKSQTPFSAAGGLGDVPTTATFKQSGENVSFEQTLTQSAVTATTSNIVQGDGGYPLGATNFDLTKATAFSAGDLPLALNPINDSASSADGSTDANATVELTYAGQSVTVEADSKGRFSVPLSAPLTVGEEITARANKNFLTVQKSVTVTGSVTISDLPDIPFNAIGTPRYSARLERLDPDWAIELTDTRVGGGHWALYVAAEGPLQSGENVIEQAVTFTDGNTSVVGSFPTLVAEGQTDRAQTIRLSWESAKGVLLDISENQVYQGGKYVARLNWNVEFD